MNQKRGLGRGLGALIPSGPRVDEHGAPIVQPRRDTRPVSVAAGHPLDALLDHAADSQSEIDALNVSRETSTGGSDLQVVTGVRYAELPLAAIRPNPRQPRQVFEEEALDELVHSIREVGLLQPIVVRPLAEPDGDVWFELVAGERRWRASHLAGLDPIPAIVRETGDEDLLRDALLENLHRSALNALEEAAAYQQLLDDFGCTQDELATRIGRSRPQVSNTLRLLKLPPAVQRRVAAGVLSAGHARALLGLDDSAAMDQLATRIVAEGLSVRSVEEIVSVGAGDGRERKRTSRARKLTAPGLTELGDRLAERLETRVRVDAGKTKGKVVIEFATLEDLRRIVDLIDD